MQKHDAADERNPPAPRGHLLGRQHDVDEPGSRRPEDEADGGARGRGAADEAAHHRRRELGRVDHRARELAAEREALNQPHQDEQQRRGDADLVVGRQQAEQRASRRPSARSTPSAARAGRCDRRPGRAPRCRPGGRRIRARTPRRPAAAGRSRSTAERTACRCRWRNSRRRRNRTTRGRCRSGRRAPCAAPIDAERCWRREQRSRDEDYRARASSSTTS